MTLQNDPTPSQSLGFCRFVMQGVCPEVRFCESLVENARFRSLDSHFWCKSHGKSSFWNFGFPFLLKVSDVQRECPDKVSSRSVQQGVSFQECTARVSSKSVQQKRQARVSRKSVQQGRLARVSSKECPARHSVLARLFSKSVKQECQERASRKSG